MEKYGNRLILVKKKDWDDFYLDNTQSESFVVGFPTGSWKECGCD